MELGSPPLSSAIGAPAPVNRGSSLRGAIRASGIWRGGDCGFQKSFDKRRQGPTSHPKRRRLSRLPCSDARRTLISPLADHARMRRGGAVVPRLAVDEMWAAPVRKTSEGGNVPDPSAVIADLGCVPARREDQTRWRLVTDGVMGGVSTGALEAVTLAGRPALRMQGVVSLRNNGGFIQMVLDFSPGGGPIDASAWSGIELDVFGNGEAYGAHLRTDVLNRPWQSYRQAFTADAAWRTIQLPFDEFVPYRTDVPLDRRRLVRIGLAAIGREFSADLAVGGLRFMERPRVSTESSP